MQNPDEAQLIDGVIERLADKFPDRPRADIERAVAEVHQEFEGNPVRDYVPVLVEREARQLLRDSE